LADLEKKLKNLGLSYGNNYVSAKKNVVQSPKKTINQNEKSDINSGEIDNDVIISAISEYTGWRKDKLHVWTRINALPQKNFNLGKLIIGLEILLE